MLKKAGIVVAAAAAGLLAVSPLAFAGDKDDHNGHHGHGKDKVEIEDVNKVDESSEGLINVADNNVNVPIQACNNDVPVNVLGIQVSDVQADLVGALGILGAAEAERVGQTGDTRTCEQDAEAGDEVEQEND